MYLKLSWFVGNSSVTQRKGGNHKLRNENTLSQWPVGQRKSAVSIRPWDKSELISVTINY
jgi:hypothetical protein